MGIDTKKADHLDAPAAGSAEKHLPRRVAL